MGTYPRRCPLTTADIVERYQGGEGLGMLGLRCRRSTGWVRDVLIDAGVEIRTARQTMQMVQGPRSRPSRRRVAQVQGSNPWGQP